MNLQKKMKELLRCRRENGCSRKKMEERENIYDQGRVE